MIPAIFTTISRKKTAHYLCEIGSLAAAPYLALVKAEELYSEDEWIPTLEKLKQSDVFPCYPDTVFLQPIPAVKLAALRSSFGKESFASLHCILDVFLQQSTVIYNDRCRPDGAFDHTIGIERAWDCVDIAAREITDDSAPGYAAAFSDRLWSLLKIFAHAPVRDPITGMDFAQLERLAPSRRALYCVIEPGDRADFYTTEYQAMPPALVLTKAVSSAAENHVPLIQALENMDLTGEYTPGLPVKDRLMERLDMAMLDRLSEMFESTYEIGARVVFDFEDRQIYVNYIPECFAEPVQNVQCAMPEAVFQRLEGGDYLNMEQKY